MPTNTYDLACNIDILSRPRITASKGRFTTSDPKVQRILSRYPNVTLVSTEPDVRTVCAGGQSSGPLTAPEVEVRTHCGLQIREKEPSRGPRIADR